MGQGGEGLWIWGSGNRLEMEPNTATRPDSRRIPPRAQGSNELGGFQLCNPQELQWSSVCLFVEEKKTIMYNKGGLFNYQSQQLLNIKVIFSILDFHFLAYKFLLYLLFMSWTL